GGLCHGPWGLWAAASLLAWCAGGTPAPGPLAFLRPATTLTKPSSRPPDDGTPHGADPPDRLAPLVRPTRLAGRLPRLPARRGTGRADRRRRARLRRRLRRRGAPFDATGRGTGLAAGPARAAIGPPRAARPAVAGRGQRGDPGGRKPERPGG